MNEEERRKFYNSTAWRHKRQEVLERDNYECQWCKEKGRVTTQADAVLEVDHIYELKDYPKLALRDDNLRTLCRRCHNERHDRLFIHTKRKSDKWQDENW